MTTYTTEIGVDIDDNGVHRVTATIEVTGRWAPGTYLDPPEEPHAEIKSLRRVPCGRAISVWSLYADDENDLLDWALEKYRDDIAAGPYDG